MKKKNKSLKSGFSLIELSLTLVVISCITVAVLTKYVAGKDISNNDKVMDELKRIRSAIKNYVDTKGYYPCPGDPTLKQGDANFGIGQRNASRDDSDGYLNYTGLCDVRTGYTHLQVIDFDTTNDVNLATYFGNNYDTVTDTGKYELLPAEIITGDPPCKDLGLSDDCMIDPNGNKYSYTVSVPLTSPYMCKRYMYGNAATRFSFIDIFNGNANNTFIRVIKSFTDANANGKVDASDLATDYGTANNAYTDPQFVLMYYGKDGIGSYPAAGASSRKTPVTISAGIYAGDSMYQEINHKLHLSSDAAKRYFLAPSTPLSSSITFGDILVMGSHAFVDNPATTYDMMYCAVCATCSTVANVTRQERFVVFPKEISTGGFAGGNVSCNNITANTPLIHECCRTPNGVMPTFTGPPNWNCGYPYPSLESLSP